MSHPDFMHLPEDAPIHSFNVSYMYLFGCKQVFGSVEMHLERPIRAYDSSNVRQFVMSNAKPSPINADSIVILSISPMGVIPKSVYLQLVKENSR